MRKCTIRTTHLRRLVRSAALLLVTSGAAFADPPPYMILDIGVAPGHASSQGFRVSPAGVATGRSLPSPIASSRAYSWTQAGGLVVLDNLPTRNFCVGNAANDNGQVVGTGSTTSFGSGPLPVMWTNGAPAALPLPAGQTLGRANDVNASGVAVGSVNGGNLERGSMYAAGTGSIITAMTSNGSFIRTAFGINDSGRIVGIGADPNNAAVNVGYVYDRVSDHAFTVGALPGRNGAICFDVSNAGHVCGSTMLNQGSGTPFVWTDANGMVEIPLPAGTTQGSARGVNSNGWAVGTASGLFAIPFLYDGTATYRIADLIPAGTGWDLSTNTSSSALGISENGIIVGSGVLNGAVHGYALIPAEPACPCDWNMVDGLDSQDLFDYYEDFFAGNADFNGIDGTDSQDLFDFFECFFDACP